jgi:Nucleotidyltransferase of unknown function (DUF6036)
VRREDLEHVIRAAAQVAQDREIVVIGSQAILAQFPHAPAAMLFSQEADIYPRNHPARAVEIDGALGDGSRFHATFGYYAHGVGPETAKAPAGWEARLVALPVPLHPGGAEQAIGWCLEAHDLVLAKCAAGREHDWDFAQEAIRCGLVEPQELLTRVPDLPLTDAQLQHLRTLLTGIIARAGK